MPPRRRIWGDTSVGEVTATATQDTQTLSDELPGEESEHKGYTLVRMVIDLSISPAPPVTGSILLQEMFFGIGMISIEALNAGIFPDTQVAGDNPVTGWLWRGHVTITERPDKGHAEIRADIRTQRKLMYGLPVLIMDSVATSGAGFSMLTSGIIRCLYLAP